MHLFKSAIMYKYTFLIFAIGWLIFASYTRLVDLALPESGCSSASNAPYLFLVTYGWTAPIATCLTIPAAGLILMEMMPQNQPRWVAVVLPIMLGAQILACSGDVLLAIGGVPIHQSSLQTPTHRYHIASCEADLDYVDYILYECDHLDLHCTQIIRAPYGAPLEGKDVLKMRLSPDGKTLYLHEGQGDPIFEHPID